MNKFRTVTLELLRHGPPHNQLLSPLTQYLALCGNHSATTVTMPFEHNQLLLRLNAFKYKDSPETLKLQLKDTAQIMASVLGEVPGLIAELAETPGPTTGLTHLRLILSASELALLPFELANSPNGFPGAGQPLALQAQAPVCMTREVRRVTNTRFRWPVKPRILFAAASPPGVGPVPLEAHLLALRRVIEPWVDSSNNGESPESRLRRHLVVLPQASVVDLEDSFAAGDFTHVHILAHGIAMPGENEKRYGLALHRKDNPGKMDVVDGARLATMIRTYRHGGSNALSGPAVLTLASCDSGDQGSVVGAGASVAHALHEGGIPLVIAAQFPLSFAASVLMTDVLYAGLLWGVDPRTLLNDLRWQLKAKIQDTHDWASIVAYASLPDNIGAQLSNVRVQQAHRSINSALKYMDKVTVKVKGTGGGGKQLLYDARTKMADAVRRLRRLLRETTGSSDRALIYGLLASTKKRDAKILHAASESGTSTGEPGPSLFDQSTNALRQARRYYAKAFRADPTQIWALVQELSLAVLLEGNAAMAPEMWTVAKVLSEADLNCTHRRRAWALCNLIELYLLALLNPKIHHPASAKSKTLEYTRQLLSIAENTIELYSHRRQIERYADWFARYDPMPRLVPLANQLLTMMPYNSRFE